MSWSPDAASLPPTSLAEMTANAGKFMVVRNIWENGSISLPSCSAKYTGTNTTGSQAVNSLNHGYLVVATDIGSDFTTGESIGSMVVEASIGYSGFDRPPFVTDFFVRAAWGCGFAHVDGAFSSIVGQPEPDVLMGTEYANEGKGVFNTAVLSAESGGIYLFEFDATKTQVGTIMEVSLTAENGTTNFFDVHNWGGGNGTYTWSVLFGAGLQTLSGGTHSGIDIGITSNPQCAYLGSADNPIGAGCTCVMRIKFMVTDNSARTQVRILAPFYLANVYADLLGTTSFTASVIGFSSDAGEYYNQEAMVAVKPKNMGYNVQFKEMLKAEKLKTKGLKPEPGEPGWEL